MTRQKGMGGARHKKSPEENDSVPITEGLRPVGGAMYGGLAFIVSFIISTTYTFYHVDNYLQETDGFQSLAFTPLFDRYQEMFGWTYYNGLGIPITGPENTEINVLDQSMTGSSPIDSVFLAPFADVNQIVIVGIIAGTLFIAGGIVARRTAKPVPGVAGAVAGASTAIGYVSLLFVGAWLLRIEESEFGISVSFGPEIGFPLLIVGIFIAGFFGGLGGYVLND